MDIFNTIIDYYDFPVLTAFVIGVLTSISPCPLATNITAVAYISKDVNNPKNSLLNGFYYTLGRGISYTLLAMLIFFGLSIFDLSRLFQGWGDKILGPILIIIGLIMLGVIKINVRNNNQLINDAKEFLANKGYLGSLLLGMLFALAFCPYSGVLFFGMLIPLVLTSTESLLLPPIFALGTGLPVIMFAFIIAYGTNHLGKAFSIVSKVETFMRLLVAGVFLITGIYYLQFLVKYFI